MHVCSNTWNPGDSFVHCKVGSGLRDQLGHLVSLETFICNGLIHGDHAVMVFLDPEKAYDTTWKYGIMQK